jgi:hypothetical protein
MADAVTESAWDPHDSNVYPPFVNPNVWALFVIYISLMLATIQQVSSNGGLGLNTSRHQTDMRHSLQFPLGWSRSCARKYQHTIFYMVLRTYQRLKIALGPL